MSVLMATHCPAGGRDGSSLETLRYSNWMMATILMERMSGVQAERSREERPNTVASPDGSWVSPDFLLKYAQRTRTRSSAPACRW